MFTIFIFIATIKHVTRSGSSMHHIWFYFFVCFVSNSPKISGGPISLIWYSGWFLKKHTPLFNAACYFIRSHFNIQRKTSSATGGGFSAAVVTSSLLAETVKKEAFRIAVLIGCQPRTNILPVKVFCSAGTRVVHSRFVLISTKLHFKPQPRYLDTSLKCKAMLCAIQLQILSAYS